MQLPQRADGRGVEIGPSDILAWRSCPARAKAGRLRLVGQEMPEMQSSASAYGIAVHLMIERLEADDTVDRAVQAAFAAHVQWLEPADIERLADDARTYLTRDLPNVRTLLSEGEISVPLFTHPEQGQVWLRGRIDRLYQSVFDSGALVFVDYKTSRQPLSHEEVSKDIKMWAYDLLIHEWFTDLYPEVERVTIEGLYDQLLHGQIPTRKSSAQRQVIREWLIRAITAMIDDEEELPRFNDWCAWCGLKMDCPVVQHQLGDWATTRIAALMPREVKLKKDGTPSKALGKIKLDRERIREYVDLLPDVKKAIGVLKEFDTTVTDTLRAMPDSDLHLLGKRKIPRGRRSFTTEAKRLICEEVGLSRFLMLVDISLANVQRFFASEPEVAARIESYATSVPGEPIIGDA